ncbi:MAG: hypothetical protein ACI350_07135 [Prevotella sp.]
MAPPGTGEPVRWDQRESCYQLAADGRGVWAECVNMSKNARHGYRTSCGTSR